MDQISVKCKWRLIITLLPIATAWGQPWSSILRSEWISVMPGRNRILRSSTASTLTIPSNFNGADAGDNHCECGWPHHLLVPRGTTDGMVFDFFAMVTDGEVDEVDTFMKETPSCKASHIVCGRVGQRYPDARPMGYPFDRAPFKTPWLYFWPSYVSNLDDFIRPNKNMMTVQVEF